MIKLSLMPINLNIYQYIYCKYIYYNPNIVYNLIKIYRVMVILMFIITFSYNNPIKIIELLTIFEENYFNEWLNNISFFYLDSLKDSNGFFKIYPLYNPYGEGPSIANPWGQGSGGGFSGQGPEGGGNIQFLGEHVNTRRRTDDSTKVENQQPIIYEDRFVLSKDANLQHEGPKFCYKEKMIDRNKYNEIHPEKYHRIIPLKFGGDRLRVYDDHAVRYTYKCGLYNEKNETCEITYPDQTKLTIYYKPTVLKHIEYHKHQIYLSNRISPMKEYSEYYRNHFESFRQQHVERAAYPDLHPIPDRQDMLKISSIFNTETK